MIPNNSPLWNITHTKWRILHSKIFVFLFKQRDESMTLITKSLWTWIAIFHWLIWPYNYICCWIHIHILLIYKYIFYVYIFYYVGRISFWKANYGERKVKSRIFFSLHCKIIRIINKIKIIIWARDWGVFLLSMEGLFLFARRKWKNLENGPFSNLSELFFLVSSSNNRVNIILFILYS